MLSRRKVVSAGWGLAGHPVELRGGLVGAEEKALSTEDAWRRHEG